MLETNIFYLIRTFTLREDNESKEVYLIDTLVQEHVDSMLHKCMEEIYEDLRDTKEVYKVDENFVNL